jgi:DNA repair exonuclease SbcCD ATPase subunit
VLIRAHQAL